MEMRCTSAICKWRISSQTGSWSSRRKSFLSGAPPDLLGTYMQNPLLFVDHQFTLFGKINEFLYKKYLHCVFVSIQVY